ncbi:MAG: Uma2 family endonuclease [Caldilineaceae bacterium]
MSAVAELISPQEYLELERQSETKHEYIDGRMVEMPGASEVHNTIVSNIIISIGIQLRGRPGKVYSSDMRVRIPATDRYTYPDVVAITNKPALEEDEFDVLVNPAVIVEVLSDSTSNYDRGEKFQNYRTIETLQEYLMIYQDSPRVEHYVRQSDGQWLFSETTNVAEIVYIPTIECDLPLSEIYDDVDFDNDTRDLNGHQRRL